MPPSSPTPSSSVHTAVPPASAPAPHTPRPPLTPLDQALAELLAHAAPLDAAECVACDAADGRVLAQDVVSEMHVPAWDNSAVDGYALRCADWVDADTWLPVHQRIAAGTVGASLVPGALARIFTGAPLPAGADAVVMQEDCEVAEGTAPLPSVRLHKRPVPGQCIRRQGEDVRQGAVVLPRGKRLGPAEIGLAASIGFAHLLVARRPRVALFSTGDELVMPGEVAPAAMPPGAIYNANRFFLKILLERLGCQVSDLGALPDQRQATLDALQAASQNHDLILTSGGVSVGEEDHVKPAVQTLGSLHLWQIAMKPGKPFAYGRIGAAHFMGLPGNPVSSLVTFLLLVRPFLARLQGAQNVTPASSPLIADFNWPQPDKRREFLRVKRNAAGRLDLFANQSSGVLTSAVWADGLVDNPANQAIKQGDVVQFIALADLLR